MNEIILFIVLTNQSKTKRIETCSGIFSNILKTKAFFHILKTKARKTTLVYEKLP
jgi:hypothetical protein